VLTRPPKRRRAAPFLADRRSVAALELAIVLPLLLALLAGVYDLSELVIIRAEVYSAAESIAASASSLAVQQDGATALTYTQVQEVESQIFADVPTLRNGLKVTSPLSITMSSLLFHPSPYAACAWNNTTSCNYIADVAWSESYVGTGTNATFDYTDPTTQMEIKDCANYLTDQSNQVNANATLSGYQNVTLFRTLQITSSGATAAPNNTVADEAGVPPMLAVSIQYTYQPLFSIYITGPFTFWVDAYWPVRSVKTNVPASTFNYGFGNVTTEPLGNQFTSIVGTPGPGGNGGTATGGNAAAYCVNPGVTGAVTVAE